MAGEFVALSECGVGTYFARKKLKVGRLKVGDLVEVDDTLNVVESVLPRKNELLRPPVANVDVAFIVVAVVPAPDFLLIDKLLLKFFRSGIEPVILCNKMDLDGAEEFLAQVRRQYDGVCSVYGVCAKRGQEDILPILRKTDGKFAIFTGQSAVGKTSLLRVLLPNLTMAVGEMSAKTARGKNTTRHSEIFVLNNNGMIADTPGFSAFELDDFLPEDVIDYTVELGKFSSECKYRDCNHLGESQEICAVKRAVARGEMNQERYSRYCELYRSAKDKENKKYE